MGLKSAFLFWLALLAILQITAAERYRRTVFHHDELVIKCDPENNRNLKTLFEEDFVDPWGVDDKGNLDIQLSHSLWKRHKDDLPNCNVTIDNLEAYMQEMDLDILQKRESKEVGWFEDYHTYEEILDWYQQLAEENPEAVTYVKTIGQSYEGRDTPAVHITRAPDKTNVKRILFQCLIHAREWVSGSVCMYIADYLCANYGIDPNVTRLLDEMEFIFIPVVNPDGYVFTWTDNRLWRKGRSETAVPGCFGTDLNRNYNIHWREGGSSNNPCSTTYAGAAPQSEPEINNTVNYFKANAPVIGAIDWHAYSQFILRPWGWTTDPSPDEEVMAIIGDEMKDVIFGVHGTVYKSGRWSVLLYLGTGVSSDWYYSEEASATNMGFRAAGYNVELRDQGQYGFRLPRVQVSPEICEPEILPSAEEVLPAALLFAERLLDNPIEYRSSE